jgi:DNA primase
MAFSPQFLDELRARLSLADVIGKRVRLTRRGREHLGLCPFHKEKTPSFTVNEDKGFYHCFGCGAHGSVIDFVMQIEGLSFPEAVERLAGEAGLPVPTSTPAERAAEQRRQTLIEVMEMACKHFERTLRLPEGRAAMEYLTGRGLKPDTIARFRLGFALDAKSALKGALGRAGVAEGLMIEAGLLIQPEEEGRATYDRFRGRVMFPISDRRGRIIAFGGRVLGDGDPKYLNSPETPLFHKGATLYALALASSEARARGTIIVTEGYMDVIALHQAGFPHAVAPLGTALTESQIQLLWRFAREPVLCFDGDAAGGRAAVRAAERALPFLKPGYGLRFAMLPEGEDPDSLIRRHGPDVMVRVLEAAAPLSELLWRVETEGRPITTPEARAALEERLKAHAVRIQDPTVRGHFLASFKDRLWRELRAAQAGLPGSGLRTGGGRWRAERPLGTPSVPPSTGTPVATTEQAERVLIAIVAHHPGFFHEVEDALGMAHFADPTLDHLRQALVSALSTAETPTDVAGTLAAQGLADALNAVLNHPLIKGHRLIAPGAPLEGVRQTWDENRRLLDAARLAAETRHGQGTLAADLSEESWERQRALLSALTEAED